MLDNPETGTTGNTDDTKTTTDISTLKPKSLREQLPIYTPPPEGWPGAHLKAELLAKLNTATAAVNEAEQAAQEAKKAAETASAELVSRGKALGLLLIEAKKLHPKVKEFEAFLERVDGLKLSRAYDFIRLAGGRTTDEELKRDARERKQRSRAAKKKALPKAAPALKKPEPLSVTPTPVTETSSPSAEQPDFVTKPVVTETAKAGADARKPSADKATEASARALAEFKVACDHWLPKITADADRANAWTAVVAYLGEPKAEAA